MTRDPQRAAGLDPAEVCELPPEGRAERLAWIRREILPHAVATERLPDGLAWELASAPGLAASLDALVARERACCAGLRFEHAPSAVADRERLEIHGVDPDAPIFRSLLPPSA